MWQNKKLVGLIDFENVSTINDTIIKDISGMLQYSCRDKKYKYKLDLRLAKFFLQEYGEEIKKLCPECYGQRLASLGLYQILNNEKKEGRSNVLKSLKFRFSLNYCFLFILSFILKSNQLKYICLIFFKMKKIIENFFRKSGKPVID